jgi:hypothetical protein
MKKILFILLLVPSFLFSQPHVQKILKTELDKTNWDKKEINYSYPRKHKIDISNNVGLVFGGLVFITAGYLGERNISKNNGFQGIARVVSPGKVAMILGSGCVVIGITMKF